MNSRIKIKSLNQSLSKIQTLFVVSKTNSKVKTNRIKTLEKETVHELLNIQSELDQLGYKQQFLRTLFQIKCQENQVKVTDIKYRIFVKGFHNKLINNRKIIISDLVLKELSFTYFINNIYKIETLIGLDLSNIKLHGGISPLINLLNNHQTLVQLHLRNLNLQAQDFKQIFDIIIKTQRIVHLDISNKSSQSLNRFGQNNTILEQFLQKNETLIFLQLQGLCLKDKGFQAIQRAFKMNKNSGLLYLNLKNNDLSKNSYFSLKTLLNKSNINQINLTDNNLTDDGISDLFQLKYSRLKILNLTKIQLQSKGLIYLLEKLKDNKDLKILILDKNDFSNNWFMKIQKSLTVNQGIEQLSMVDCRINFVESLFKGLTNNTYLLKLNISNNSIDKRYDQLEKLIKTNRTLIELKMKFCNIGPFGARRIAISLLQNKKLRTLDLSENPIGSQVGKQMLKCLYNNSYLINLNLQRTQVEMSTRKFIEQKLQLNQTEYQKFRRTELIRQNAIIKQKDCQRKDNLPQMLSLISDNNRRLNSLKYFVENLTEKFNEKKKNIQQLVNCHEMELSNLNKKITQMQVDSRPIIKELEYQISIYDNQLKQLNKQKIQSIKILEQLEHQCKTEKLRIANLEYTLEQKYQNLKYLNKKKCISLPKLQRKSLKTQPIYQDKKNFRIATQQISYDI